MKAKYTLNLPAHARPVGLAAHQYLTTQVPGVLAATLTYGHPHDCLHVWGEDSPELDSHIKQTATFAAEASASPSIDVLKQGKNVHHWTMSHPGAA